VALKVLPEAFAKDAERMARFQREAQVLASLNHPNIAAIYGLEESGGVRALVMELVEGPTLAEKIRVARDPLSGPAAFRGEEPQRQRAGVALQIDESLYIAKQIAEGLEYAHEKRVIHRDLKPANVKVRPDGTAKILDFGLAKALEETPTGSINTSPMISAAATREGMILGTAAYMSPEQARGQAVDRRADIWSFGCVLYEILAGKRVFEGDRVSDTLAAVLRAEPDWDAVPAATPPRLRDLIRRCLIKDSRQRLRDIGEARIAIEEMMSGDVGVTLAVASRQSQGPLLRRALLVTGGIVAGAIAAVLVTLTLTTGLSRKSEPQLGAVHFEISPPESYTIASDPSVPNVAVSPDGRMIAFAAADSKGDASLWVHPLASTTAQRLENTDGAEAPFWSPDSRAIGYFADGKLLRIPVTRGSPQTLCEAKDWAGGTWSQEGVILFGQRHGPVMRVGAEGGQPAPATKLEKGYIRPQFLPDGRHFLYLDHTSSSLSDNAVYIGALGSQQVKFLLKNESEARFSPPDHLLFGRGGVLLAQALDTRRLELKREAVRIAEGVRGGVLGVAAFSTSSNGILAYRGGQTNAFGTCQLTWFNREGRKLELAGPPGTYSEIALSPDEKRVAVDVSTDPNDQIGSLHLWLLDLSNGVFSRLTFDSSPEVDPAWSPDSREIIYALGKPGSPEIMRLTLGSTRPQKVYSDGVAEWLDDWSPDGKYLAYHNDGASAFFALPMAGGAKPITLVQDLFFKDQLHFSPDGKWVAYNSNESGRHEVYVASFPRMDQKRQVSNVGGGEPLWSKDGKELFYLSLDGKMMAVTVSEGTTLETGPPKKLFQTSLNSSVPQTSQYAVARNGQRFLLLEPVKTQEARRAEPIRVIVNWDAALEK